DLFYRDSTPISGHARSVRVSARTPDLNVGNHQTPIYFAEITSMRGRTMAIALEYLDKHRRQVKRGLVQ
ncbi:MAG: hypothetical protein ACRDNF_06695, partial [Streptosporangiaceae bacterium]